MNKENKESLNKIYTDIGIEYRANIDKIYKNRFIASIVIYGSISLISLIIVFLNKTYLLLFSFVLFILFIIIDKINSDKEKKIELSKSDTELGQIHYLDNKYVKGHNNKIFIYYFKTLGIIIICILAIAMLAIYSYTSSVSNKKYDKYVDIYGYIRYIELKDNYLKIALNDNNIEYRLSSDYLEYIESNILDLVNTNDYVHIKANNKIKIPFISDIEEIDGYNYLYYLEINGEEYLSKEKYDIENKKNNSYKLIIFLSCILIDLILSLILSILKIYTNKAKLKENIDINELI